MELNGYEPKMNNRFVVEFPKEFELESWLVTKINRPKFNFETNAWENIKIDFVDPVAISTSKKLLNIINNLGSEKDILDNKINIKTLDPTGVTVENWIIVIDKILLIDLGDSDYGNNEMQSPYMVIKPLYCTINKL